MVEAEVIEAETAEAGADIKEGKHYPDLLHLQEREKISILNYSS